MFETVAPETFHTRSRRVFYETLPVSLAVHALAIGGAVLATVWNVAFPSQSPRLIVPYSLTAVPDPPPPPPAPPAAATPRQLDAPKAPPPPTLQVVAPTIIPDLIPQVVDPPPLPPQLEPVPVKPVEPVPAGVPGGVKEGVPAGQIGGKLHGVAGGIALGEDGRVHVDRAEKLPLKTLEQEFPRYPDSARKEKLNDRVVARYVIGKNGRVNDVSIIEHAKNPVFDETTVEVIRKWRFRAMQLNGQPVEVVHEVEVFYQYFER